MTTPTNTATPPMTAINSILAREAERESTLGGIGRKIVYDMFVIVVLLIIWQFLGSL